MKRTIIWSVIGFMIAITVSGCQTTKEAPNVSALSVDFSWNDTTACSSKSPAFKIGNVPTGTKTLKFWMTDLDLPSYMHGGGAVAYTGSSEIPQGAFSYTGPCPPSKHEYQWEVTALNAGEDTILGRGKATRPFPPK